MEHRMINRLKKELDSIQKNYKDLSVTLINNDFREWHVDFECAKGTIYEGEKYKLRFKFPPEYPIEAPEVIF